MEKLHYTFEECRPLPAARSRVLVGVVASGNLEVLMEGTGEEPQRARFQIETAAAGFGCIWEAVLRDFTQRHAVGGIQFSINDAGATPAVVMLRLEQAVSEWTASAA
jgi:malonate decarboxylase delta subunit